MPTDAVEKWLATIPKNDELRFELVLSVRELVL